VKHLSRVRPHSRFRSKIVLDFLSDNLLVDIKIGNPVPVLFERHWYNVVKLILQRHRSVKNISETKEYLDIRY
jgi:hypothetical protein